MKLIVGLGNPGDKYRDTRHNIGFMVVEHLANEIGGPAIPWSEETKHHALVARRGEIILVKPTTFMNASGMAVSSVASYYKISPGDIWVIHDDLDLPIGKIRIRTGGGSAGHNGVESIMREIKTDVFTRFRLGIGRGMEATKKSSNRNFHRKFVLDFVLSKFRRGEAGDLKHMVKRGTEALHIALLKGLDKAMNRFN
ncbi:aminoacyl-tRNA hydrolase [Candidatus Gottesmanbacteria bacterium RIFCSPLOWO2_01_FULL_43_11b]|uniref:Peptidyl-tRNA hydrolase n=1 Tax=Candidatus Gottesmanbacteria bacterium RIFCSPLOWO2_01_FULL_43_11b TaxID=1798392 RepID=A0A1F6AI96_9BACT|nr:MAG: aminoacyl-tRNA hydrolase [Candidatus Gottesmanbacteria bacterium RIFCSPLOWO2_01_FULL_43_11b]